jgi:hypothetical protein
MIYMHGPCQIAGLTAAIEQNAWLQLDFVICVTSLIARPGMSRQAVASR